MVAAFPLFWNYRYKVEGIEELPEVEFDLPGGEKRVIKVEGKTPLEYYLPCLFEEPPQNDAFNLEIFEVLKYQVNSLSSKRQCRESDEDYEMFYEEVMIGDLVFFELLRSAFKIWNSLWSSHRIHLKERDRQRQLMDFLSLWQNGWRNGMCLCLMGCLHRCFIRPK
jgi:hypothetical protein